MFAGAVKPDGTTTTVSSDGTIHATASSSYTLPTATASVLGGVKPDGTRITVTDAGVISVPIATEGAVGLARPDGTTTTIGTDGKLHAIGGGGGGGSSDHILTFTDSVAIKYIPLTFPPTATGANFYGRDFIEILQGNADRVSRTEIAFTWRNGTAAGVTYSAEYGNSVASAWWVDTATKTLWLKFNAIANAGDKCILRNFNPYTMIGDVQSTAPEGSTFTNYALKWSDSGGAYGLPLSPKVNSTAPVSLTTQRGMQAFATSANWSGVEHRISATAVIQYQHANQDNKKFQLRQTLDNGVTWSAWTDVLLAENTGWV
jgi:hypothetical protein